MDRSTVLVKLSKVYAMASSPSNPNEAESAEEKFWNIAATHGLTASDLLTNENPERELVQSFLHEMNEITAKISSLVRHAVEEDKRQSDRFMEWLSTQFTCRLSIQSTCLLGFWLHDPEVTCP